MSGGISQQCVISPWFCSVGTPVVGRERERVGLLYITQDMFLLFLGGKAVTADFSTEPSGVSTETIFRTGRLTLILKERWHSH